MAVECADGSRVDLGPGGAFEVGPGHDARVIGDQLCMAWDVKQEQPTVEACRAAKRRLLMRTDV